MSIPSFGACWFLSFEIIYTSQARHGMPVLLDLAPYLASQTPFPALLADYCAGKSGHHQ